MVLPIFDPHWDVSSVLEQILLMLESERVIWKDKENWFLKAHALTKTYVWYVAKLRTRTKLELYHFVTFDFTMKVNVTYSKFMAQDP